MTFGRDHHKEKKKPTKNQEVQSVTSVSFLHPDACFKDMYVCSSKKKKV